jgi:hypothetical protein
MNMITFDGTIHIVEAFAIIFWIGVSWSDVKWIKAEVKHLRELLEGKLFK